MKDLIKGFPMFDIKKNTNTRETANHKTKAQTGESFFSILFTNEF